MTTRVGKIARLPREVREELNFRLLNNEPGADLVTWLNSRDDVRAVLQLRFEGRPITEQNLSEWRTGGFEDWIRFQDTRDWIRGLVEKSSTTLDESDTLAITDWLAVPLGVALGQCIHNHATNAPHSVEERKNLIHLARELCQLRRGDHQQQALRLKRDYFEATFPKNPTKSD